jgi:hypothetical protein
MMVRAGQEWMRTEILTAAIEINAVEESLRRSRPGWSHEFFITAADQRIRWVAERMARVQESITQFGVDTPPRCAQGDDDEQDRSRRVK